ncbi:MAG: tyrosyl-tRNA synthetase, partial [Dehalococcoidia bacterium]|nr:tyrosyl-tRNA synthetase [Dehalococcoidia bacterium]
KAVEAEEHFTRVVREREMPEDIDKFYIDGISPSRSTGSVYSSTGILVDIGLAPSRSAANRLLAQGAVEIDGRKLGAQDKEIELLPGSVIKVGKRRFVRIVDSDKES